MVSYRTFYIRLGRKPTIRVYEGFPKGFVVDFKIVCYEFSAERFRLTRGYKYLFIFYKYLFRYSAEGGITFSRLTDPQYPMELILGVYYKILTLTLT